MRKWSVNRNSARKVLKEQRLLTVILMARTFHCKTTVKLFLSSRRVEFGPVDLANIDLVSQCYSQLAELCNWSSKNISLKGNLCLSVVVLYSRVFDCGLWLLIALSIFALSFCSYE